MDGPKALVRHQLRGLEVAARRRAVPSFACRLVRQFAEAADRPSVDLLTEIRRAHAVHRLGQNLQSVAAIGEAVGYLSEAALQRACRRHTRGATPHF